MDAEEFAKIIGNLIDDCEVDDSSREKKRLKALDYFRGDITAYVPHDKGRSGFSTRDVRAVIKKVKPSLMRVLLGSDKIGEYLPIGPNDEEAAKAATKFVNKVIVKEAGIDAAIDDAIMSALLLDEGILTWWHETRQRVAVTMHTGMTDDEMAELQSDGDIEVIEATPDIEVVEGQEIRLWRARVKRVMVESKIRVEAVPVEDFLIHPGAKTIEDSPIVGHKMTLRRSDLVSMGFDRNIVDNIRTAERSIFDDDETDARNPDDFETLASGNTIERALEEIEIARLFVRHDADNDGIAELREVWFARDGDGNGTGGGAILYEDYADEIDYAAVVAERVMHSWRGVSLFDDVEDLQTLKTVLVRQMLDNLYRSNNPQPVVQHGTITNLEAVFNGEPGQPILTRPGVSAGEALQWQAVPFFAEKSAGMVAKVDADIVDRTGITSAASGLDPNALQNVREQGVQMISDAAAAQAWSIAREMARGGIARMMRGVLKKIIQHQDKPRQIKIDEKWEEFDPRSWNAGLDFEVNTGLGTGTKERDMAALQSVAAYQKEILLSLGPTNPVVTIAQYARTLQLLTEAAGIRNPDRYFSVPDDAAMASLGQKGPTPEETKAQIDAQVKVAVEQAKAEAARAKEEAQRDADLVVERARLEVASIRDGEAAQARMQELDRKLAFEAQKHADQMALEREKMAMQSGAINPAGDVTMQAIMALAERVEAMAAAISAPRSIVMPDGRTFTAQSTAGSA